MWKLGCLVVLAVVIGIPAVASRYLPWWGTLLVIVGEAAFLLFAAPKLFGFGVKRFALGLLTTKSKVLRGASVQVHRVALTDKPAVPAAAAPAGDEEANREDDEEDSAEGDDEDDEDKPGTRYVAVDFSVTPRAGASTMQFWEPSEMLLVPFDAKVGPDDEDDPAIDDSTGSVREIRLLDESGSETADFDKVMGPARLRAVFACPPGLRGRVKFRYYLEALGDLTLPEGGTGTLAS